MAPERIDLKIPQAGESVAQVEIGQWLKAEGSPVKRDEGLVELHTDKASMELPAPNAGILKILKRTGELVEVGEVIGYIEESQKKPEATSSVPVDRPRTHVGPAARKAMRESAKPSSPVATEPAKTKPPAASDLESEVIPMTPIRREIARRLVEAKQNAALLTTFNEIDMSAVQTLRHDVQEVFQKKYSIKLGMMSFFVKAAIEALKKVPEVNARIEGQNIVYQHYYDIGIAVGSGRGLVVPVLRHAETMSFAEIEKAIADLAQKAQTNKLNVDELLGGTFTITNGGVYGSLLSTPIVNPPQSGILGLHAIQERPVAREGQIVIRPMMYVALTYDHRIVDGREAVTFLRQIKDLLEFPARMLLEI